ncbi:hypothetical protein CY34DRAFT_18291 [Suillus luteus UH-Slu-Lm8-n1]|uniref:Uncharacterized protein n=1 Tax=Suillus luteus UH-Slu-Lm8-n1 TaxID=930992 RepID=A0A0C9ZVZ8_9AGAM|nr:hypothetical protein CY34DRAFT_18291 [Suillus luteus UH-Slu-Lm8-n1]
MPPRLRHAALRAAHSFREVLASIDIVDGGDVVLTNFSPAILTSVCPQPGATPTDTGPDRFFDDKRDLCYLELIFALARNSQWHPHLYGDGHIDLCSSIVAKSCNYYVYPFKSIRLQPHAFYLAGIFLRTTSEEVSNASLRSITEQQCWDMMRKAWYSAFLTIDNTRCVEFLPELVKGTKKYMHIGPKPELEQLITDVDDLIKRVIESQDLLEHRERVVAAMKEMKDVANDTLAKFRK